MIYLSIFGSLFCDIGCILIALNSMAQPASQRSLSVRKNVEKRHRKY